MSKQGEILLKQAELSHIFPFYLLINQHCRVEDCGRTMAKLFPDLVMGALFFEQWTVMRPRLEPEVACSPEMLVGKLVVIINKERPDLRFKGQFEKIEFEKKYLFLGAPWFNDTDQLQEYDLTLGDFAMYDSMTDLLHVLKNNEIANLEMKEVVAKVNRQRLELAATNEQLRIQEEKYRNIIANMNLGLLEVDKDDRIQYANQSFCELSGYSLEEMLEKKAADLFVTEGSRQQIEEKNKLREVGQSDSFEIIARNKRGEARWWLISGAPRYNDFGDVVGSIGIHLDITEQKRLEKELSRALQSAEEASEAKAAFLANMSHEIRTPLNGVLGMIRELGKEPLSLRQNSCLVSAQKASEHLLAIINNILDISKIEAGELQLEQLNFSIRDVLNDVSSILGSQANEKLIEFKVDVDDTVAKAFLGDATRIRQVLINLAGNALKFTEKGSVSIVCSCNQVNKYHQELLFTIRDTGIGMDPDFIQNIFTKFQQAEKSSSRRFGGTGLGMAITKELIEMMNGGISVRSQKEVGTEVSVRLMLPVGDPNKIETDNGLPLQVALENRSILLVEDNEMNRLVANNALLPYKMVITEAENGLEAIEMLKKHSFDLILMDLQMPVMGGLEAMRILRQVLKIKTPVIALTANAFKSEIDLCLNAGMVDYVVKPFEEKVLIQAIAKVLVAGSSPVSQTQRSTSVETDIAAHLYDLSKLKALSRGDEAFVLKMLGLFVDMMPRSIAEIVAALNAHNLDGLKKVIHRIKPSVDNMGVMSIRQHIRDIELAEAENDLYPIWDQARFIVGVLERVVAEVRRSDLTLSNE